MQKHFRRQLVLAGLLCLSSLQATHADVTISGVDAKIRNNILAHLQLDEENCKTTEGRIRRLFSYADTEIHEALEVIGYYNASIEKKLDSSNNCWQANFVIKLGAPTRLREVSIIIDTGATKNKKTDSYLLDAVQNCALQTGDILHHANYESCTRKITQIAQDRGYFAAKFIERRIDVYPDEHAADITLYFVTGPRFVYGKITFEQSVLDPELIQRFVDFKQGDPYDAIRVRRTQRDLITSAYFDQVVFKPMPRYAPDYDVPIEVLLTPGKKYQYSAGIGFATNVGPKLRLGVLNRRINSSGHQIEFDINVSKVISETGITYRIPLNNPRDWFTIDTGYKLEDNDSFQSKLFTTGVQRIQQYENDWTRTLYLNLRIEDYEAGREDDGVSQLLTPGISFAFVEEDYPPRPTEGHRSSVYLQAAMDGLVSDTSFAQLYGSTKWVFELWQGARLLPRAELGTTLIDTLSTLPASVRYFAGGDTSVRGYAYKSLGPTNEFGEVTGGQNLLVGSVEIDQMIAAEWSLAVFVDSGNAYNALSEYDPATGVGAGVRWFSPLGPIRFDVAVPLGNDAPDEYRIHVTLGPDL